MTEGGGAVRLARVRYLLTLTVGATLVRGVFFFLRSYYLDWDEALYILMARSLLDGAGIMLNGYPHVALGPFVPLSTAFASLISGLDPFAAHHVLMALAGGLLVIPVYYLLYLASGERVADIGSILIVGWPALIDVAPKLGPMWRHAYAGSEPVFLLLLFTALALGEAGLRREGPWRHALFALGGLSLAASYLTRPEAIVVAGFYLLVRAAFALRSARWPQLASAAIVAALAFAIAIGPYLYHLRQVTGSWTPSGKYEPTALSGDMYQALVRSDRHMGAYMTVWWALEPGHTYLLNPYWGTHERGTAGQQLAGLRSTLDEVWGPEPFGVRLGRRAAAYALALWSLAGPLFAVLALIGLFGGEGEPRRRLPPFAVSGLAASALTTMMVFALPRFFLYLVPAFALWAACGVLAIVRWAEMRQLRVPSRVVALGLMGYGLIVASVRTLGEESTRLRQAAIENRLASERLASAIPPDEAVMSWHPRLAYWGHLEWRALPVASMDATAHYAAARGIRYLFLARGMYAPLQVGAPYVLLEVDPDYARAVNSAPPTMSGHVHPPIRLFRVEPVAGFPTGRIALADSEQSPGSDGHGN